MSNVLVVSGSYFPYATANAVCMKKFEDALKNNGHTVIYCNRKHDLYEPDFHYEHGTYIYTVGKNSDLFFQTIENLKKIKLPNKMHESFELSMKGYRLLQKIKNLGKSKEYLRKKAREEYLISYSTKIREIILEWKIDLVISVSMPFDSHYAVLMAMQSLKNSYSQRAPKWIAYCIDAYWSKAGILQKDIPVMKKEELEIFNACDRILFLDTIENDYIGNEFNELRNKFISLPLPLFDLKVKQENYFNEGFIRKDGVVEVVYTGTVYDDYRNADACIGVAESFAEEKVRFHFLGKIYPKSLSLFNELKYKIPEQIEIYGKQPYPYAKGSMQNADILLNLANDNANQIPSKIFEYMMTLKPILNIYRMDNDVGTDYLKKYPLAFNFDCKENFHEQINALKKWLENIKERSTSIEELDGIFHDVTSSVVCDKFIELVKQLLDY